MYQSRHVSRPLLRGTYEAILLHPPRIWLQVFVSRGIRTTASEFQIMLKNRLLSWLREKAHVQEVMGSNLMKLMDLVRYVRKSRDLLDVMINSPIIDLYVV